MISFFECANLIYIASSLNILLKKSGRNIQADGPLEPQAFWQIDIKAFSPAAFLPSSLANTRSITK